MNESKEESRLSLISRLEKLETTLFGGKLEDQFSKEEVISAPLFNDKLEKIIYFILLDLALEGKIGATSALLAEMTEKTKNTANVRLERLYYKRLIQKQQIGNALLYYVPLYELLLSAITKELVKLKVTQGEGLEETEGQLEKNILSNYLTNADLILGRSKEYFASMSNKTDLLVFNLKREL
ncbi:MAG: hypothetical protein ACFFBD_14070, partial [Candidatus Hodarchaeota archaeon]